MKEIEIPQKTKKISCDGNTCCFIYNDFENSEFLIRERISAQHPKVYFKYNGKQIHCNYCGVNFIVKHLKVY